MISVITPLILRKMYLLLHGNEGHYLATHAAYFYGSQVWWVGSIRPKSEGFVGERKETVTLQGHTPSQALRASSFLKLPWDSSELYQNGIHFAMRTDDSLAIKIFLIFFFYGNLELYFEVGIWVWRNTWSMMRNLLKAKPKYGLKYLQTNMCKDHM